MPRQVTRGQPRLLGHELVQPRLGLDHTQVGRDDREAVCRVALRVDRFQLVVTAFLLQARRTRAGRRLVQRVQTRDDDVLPILERERVLLLAVARHRLLRFGDLLFLFDDLVGQPHEVLVDRVEPQVDVLLRVLLGERRGRQRGELRVRRYVDDRHDARLLLGDDVHAAQELADERALHCALVDGGLLRRRLGGSTREQAAHRLAEGLSRLAHQAQGAPALWRGAVEERVVLQLQPLHDALGQPAAAQDAVLRVVVPDPCPGRRPGRSR